MAKNSKDGKERKKYLTTQEAAQILKISQSTVQRYVDKGMIKAEKNPITGRRAVLTSSVVTLAADYGIPLPEGF